MFLSYNLVVFFPLGLLDRKHVALRCLLRRRKNPSLYSKSFVKVTWRTTSVHYSSTVFGVHMETSAASVCLNSVCVCAFNTLNGLWVRHPHTHRHYGIYCMFMLELIDWRLCGVDSLLVTSSKCAVCFWLTLIDHTAVLSSTPTHTDII